MNILVITSSYPDFEGSYRGCFVERQVAALARRGCRVRVITPRIFDRSPLSEARGLWTVHRFRFLSQGQVLADYDRIPILPMISYLVSGVVKGYRIGKREAVDLIHAHFVIPTGLIGVLVARLLRTRLIVHAYGTEMTWGNSALLRMCVTLVLRHANAVIIISEYTRELVAKHVPSNRPVHTLYVSGVDTNRFRPDVHRVAMRRKLGLEDDDFAVLYVGNLTPRKQVDHLIEAVASLRGDFPGLRLFMAGSGKLRADLEQLVSARDLAGAATFLGNVIGELLPFVYAASDLFVLPSREEGLGLVLLEAMASGKPVVASRTSGILTVVEHGKTGLLFEPGNVDELTARIRELIEDPQTRLQMGKRARELAVEKFSEGIQTDRLMAICSQLLEDSQ